MITTTSCSLSVLFSYVLKKKKRGGGERTGNASHQPNPRIKGRELFDFSLVTFFTSLFFSASNWICLLLSISSIIWASICLLTSSTLFSTSASISSFLFSNSSSTLFLTISSILFAVSSSTSLCSSSLVLLKTHSELDICKNDRFANSSPRDAICNANCNQFMMIFPTFKNVFYLQL